MTSQPSFHPEPTIIEEKQGAQLDLNETDKQSFEGGGYTAGTDVEARSSKYADSDAGLVHKKELKKAERRLLWKLDAAILPFATLIYLGAYLDRGNIANARLQGLQEEVLEGSDTNYSIALACFFVTYIVFSIPGTLLAKYYLPSRSIACGALIWSIAATCQAAAFNKAGLYVCRLFVGIGEAMSGQATVLYLSFWYTKRDLAKRVGLFVAAGTVSGAFGGLISFGVSNITNSPIPQWRILFLIEGCPAVILAVCVFFFMPTRPETSKYLTEEQRTICLTRLNGENNVEEVGIDWRAVKRAVTDWKVYVMAVEYACINLTLGSVSGFLPTIIKGFGYSNARAQLFTVPPYAVALVFMLLLTTYSDRRQTRGIPIAVVFILGLVGWAVLLSVPATTHYSARYFACILIVTAGYANLPLLVSWLSGATANQSQRATGLGVINTIGQCLSLTSAFLFPTAEGPQYTKGASINIAFNALGLVIALIMTTYFRWENRRRDKREGGRPPRGTYLDVGDKYDLAPGFRYVV